jgi:hypothetical protein
LIAFASSAAAMFATPLWSMCVVYASRQPLQAISTFIFH